jgi:hypothetical protein
MITVEYTLQAHWKKKVIFISINANKTGKGAPKEQNKNENLFDNDMLSERINLVSYQSACKSLLLSIFLQGQCASHTNLYQSPHHQQHARSHQPALHAA